MKKALILLLGLALCLTNVFADEVPELIFEFPTAEGDEYIQGTEDIIRKAPESIFGEPDFEKMRDLPPNSQDYQLGRKVAFFRTPVAPGSPRAFICTGFLVGPDLLMTNHHCVHDNFGRPVPLELIQVYMDYYQEPNVDRTLGGVTAGVTAVLQADAPKDYALLRLDKPIGNTYGWLELDTTTRVDSSQSVKLISHNQGRSKEIVRRNSQIVDIPADHPRANVPFMFAYLADTEGGSSGSPIFLRDGTGVIGINHSSWFDRGVPTFNAGSLMSHIVPEIQEWLPRDAAPDLAVGSPRVSNEFLRPGESFTLSTTVRNQGVVAAPATTLRFYRSTDSTITPSDVEVGSASVRALAPNATTELDITLTAPISPGTYNYGACVDAVQNENATYNNCSPAVSVNVSNTPPFWIYWTQNNRNIRRATPDGMYQQALVTGGIAITDIALDVAGGKMYWTTYSAGKKIQRANLDGSNIEDVITELGEPLAIALDVTEQKIYWTESRPSKICRANFDRSNVEVLVSGLNTPQGIALDIANGKMYWTNWGPDLIQRANLDGSNVEVLVSGLHHPIGIALDVPNGKMYWTDWGAGLIQRANLDGSHVEDLITSLYLKYLALGISQIVTPTPPGPGPGPGSLDVNGDGQVTAMDLVAVALFYGTQVPSGISLPADVNADGVVNVLDLTAVAQGIDAAGNSSTFSADDVAAVLEAIAGIEAIPEAPAALRFSTSQHALLSGIAYRNVAAAFADAKHLATEDARLGKWMPLLKELLHRLSEMREIPDTTALLPNYPNPFNPETWIPYHLAQDANVTLTIYDVSGKAVRELPLGHQSAGVYESRGRAAYWDGKNQLGEKVASGVYFYTLSTESTRDSVTAGDFTATRKMLIAK